VDSRNNNAYQKDQQKCSHGVSSLVHFTNVKRQGKGRPWKITGCFYSRSMDESRKMCFLQRHIIPRVNRPGQNCIELH